MALGLAGKDLVVSVCCLQISPVSCQAPPSKVTTPGALPEKGPLTLPWGLSHRFSSIQHQLSALWVDRRDGPAGQDENHRQGDVVSEGCYCLHFAYWS